MDKTSWIYSFIYLKNKVKYKLGNWKTPSFCPTLSKDYVNAPRPS